MAYRRTWWAPGSNGDSTENRGDKFLASVDSELWALLSAREQQAASLHVGIIDGGPPRWLSKCAT